MRTASQWVPTSGDAHRVTRRSDGYRAARRVLCGPRGRRRPTAISCASPTVCALVDGDGNGALYNGSWSTPAAVDADARLVGVTCPASGNCTALDAAGRAYAFNGTKWPGPATAEQPGGTVAAIACASSTRCALVDQSGQVVVLTGTKWSSATRIDGYRPLTTVACSAVSHCVAGDEFGSIIALRGKKWGKVAAASCGSKTRCFAADEGGAVLRRAA